MFTKEEKAGLVALYTEQAGKQPKDTEDAATELGISSASGNSGGTRLKAWWANRKFKLKKAASKAAQDA
jgi:hypothetical protein